MEGQKVEHKVVLPLKSSVRIGKTIFELFDLGVEDDTRSFPVNKNSVAYRIQPDTLETSPVQQSADSHDDKEIVRDENKRLAAIYKFQNIISAELDENKLYTKILTAVFNVIPAEKALLLLYDLESGDFHPVVRRTVNGKSQQANSVDDDSLNQKIVTFVKEKHEAVLSIEPADKSGFQGDSSLPKIMLSTMCVPLLGKQQINGMLYLSLSSPIEQYTEDDLRLLTVIGHTAGMAIEHCKMMHFNMKNERLVATGATAAGISHYIKNILAGLDGSLNLLRLGIDEKDFGLADEAWNILSKNHRRLGNVVLDLLNLASEQNPHFEVSDISLIAREVVELLESQLSQEGIKIEYVGGDKEKPLYAEVDARGIHRVLLNLVTNAEHAILAKQKTLGDTTGVIKVSAGFNEKKNFVVISIEDDGVGMEREEIKKIFDLFVTSKGSAGTGLGLAVCKRIVEAHSGTITASGEKGRGSIIRFSLPVSHTEMNTNTISIQKMRQSL